MQMWYDDEEDYSRLRVFGCVSYAHTRPDKLSARALNCIFMGYPGVKSYKMWCLVEKQGKVVISWDVSINDEVFSFKRPGNLDTRECSISRVKVELEVDRSIGDKPYQNDDLDTGSHH